MGKEVSLSEHPNPASHDHLKTAGIAVRPAAAWGRGSALPVSPKITTRADAGRRVIGLAADASPSNPANEVITDSGPLSGAAEIPATSDGPVHLQPQAESGPCPTRCPSASACEPYRELIEVGLGRGRNAMAIWQDLVSDSGFNSGYQSVRRFVRKLQGTQAPPARAVILTAPGEDYGKFRVMVRNTSSGVRRAAVGW